MMKAKETVMSDKKLQLLGQQYEDDCPTYGLNYYLLLAQAEISLKAGDKDGWGRGYREGMDDGNKAGIDMGIREVVEWIEENGRMTYEYAKGEVAFNHVIWHTQLKEWNIEKK